MSEPQTTLYAKAMRAAWEDSQLVQPCCGNCMYFQQENISDHGFCQRRAPVVRAQDDFHCRPVFPKVVLMDWCGEWEAGSPDALTEKLNG